MQTFKEKIKSKNFVLCKYISSFDYFRKTLIVLSATSKGISIISFASIIGAPIGIASASFSFIFSSINFLGIMKKIIGNNKK